MIKDLRQRLKGTKGASIGVVTKGDKGVVLILKGASRSMLAIEGRKLMKSSSKKMPKDLYVFVRDPIERLQSAFQFFTDMQERRARRGIASPRARKPMTTWEDFVDRVLEGEKNPHWKPISETIEAIGVPVTPYLFEDLDTKFPLGKLKKRNKSKKQPRLDLTYRARELRKMYADDIAIRSKL